MMYMVYIDYKALCTWIQSLFIFLQKHRGFYPGLGIAQNKEMLLHMLSLLEIEKLFSKSYTALFLPPKIMKTHLVQIEIFCITVFVFIRTKNIIKNCAFEWVNENSFVNVLIYSEYRAVWTSWHVPCWCSEANGCTFFLTLGVKEKFMRHHKNFSAFPPPNSTFLQCSGPCAFFSPCTICLLCLVSPSFFQHFKRLWQKLKIMEAIKSGLKP